MTEPPDSSIEPWPLHYVQTALWFLSLPSADKADYLPPPFPAVKFHGNLGDFVTGNPLYFMVQFCVDACDVGSRIDEWMDLDPNVSLQDRFNELRAVLSAMLWQDLEKRDAFAFLRSPNDYPDMAGLFNAGRRYSNEIIADLAWSAELSSHKLRCESLLDEYSYGAYSAATVETHRGAQAESPGEPTLLPPNDELKLSSE